MFEMLFLSELKGRAIQEHVHPKIQNIYSRTAFWRTVLSVEANTCTCYLLKYCKEDGCAQESAVAFLFISKHQDVKCTKRTNLKQGLTNLHKEVFWGSSGQLLILC